jgi:hypothetical protein
MMVGFVKAISSDRYATKNIMIAGPEWLIKKTAQPELIYGPFLYKIIIQKSLGVESEQIAAECVFE